VRLVFIAPPNACSGSYSSQELAGETCLHALYERRNIEEAAAVHMTSEIEALELRALGFRCTHLGVVPNGIGPPPKQLPPASAVIGRTGVCEKMFAVPTLIASWKSQRIGLVDVG
jgi:hypothetical protein